VNGEPFTLPLQQIETYFNDMKKIRNVIVHMSQKAREKFKGMIRAKTTHYRPDMSPGEFLGLSYRRGATKTFMEHYVSYLETASSKIVPV
jgi:hypothetical protein